MTIIKLVRLVCDIPIAQAAEQLRISRSQLHGYERGYIPSADQAADLRNFYGLPSDWLPEKLVSSADIEAVKGAVIDALK